jgi:hypothetical protein
VEETRKILASHRRDLSSTHFRKTYNTFYLGSSLLSLARIKPMERKTLLRCARPYLKEIRNYVSSGSLNGVPMLKLHSAQQLALSSRDVDSVVKAYEAAITTSARSGFLVLKAIACEQLGDYLVDAGDAERASSYVTIALNDFEYYGAETKVCRLQNKFGGAVRAAREFRNKNVSKSSLVQHQPYVLQSWKQEVREHGFQPRAIDSRSTKM